VITDGEGCATTTLQLRGEAHRAVQVPDCQPALAHGTCGNLATRSRSAPLIPGVVDA
jgi:acetyl-CoA C-acetyltransferase